jgi:methyl coenzyme M reductase system subunit A2
MDMEEMNRANKTDEILRVNDLTKMYRLSDGSFTYALKGISFGVFQNETVGVIGKSGAGKTSLLRIIRGVEPFDGGSIFVDGTELTPKPKSRDIAEVKSKTAIHLQRSFALWSESTLENVMRRVQALRWGDETIPLPSSDDASYKECEDESMRLLNLVGLSHKAKQAAHTLSGGEKQRLILARQLAIRPKILLLDEPLTMAAPEDKIDSIDVIKKIQKEFEMTTLLVSHMPGIHRELSDRIIWLEDGRIIKEGGVDEIVTEFASQAEPSIEVPPLEEKKILFRLDSVSKTYWHYDLSKLFEIRDISIDVYKGEIFGIVGPCGVGKTVLVRILAGLESPEKGNVICFTDGEAVDLTRLGLASALIRRRIGILHQEFGLTHHARIEDIIESRTRFKSFSKEKFEEIVKKADIRESQLDFILRLADVPVSMKSDILDELELSEEDVAEIYAELPMERLSTKDVEPIFDLLDLSPDIMNRRAYELSGGEKIRVALAVELAMRPDLLILDEPFGDVDPVTARRVSNMLKRINTRYNTTFVIVSHDRELLYETAHRIILIEDGELKEDLEGRLHNI